MAKTEIKIKEPITLRQKKLKDGRISLYLDTYISYSGEAGRNHSHSYEFLKLYLVPEITKEDKVKNASIMKAALAVKNQRLLDRANNIANISTANGKLLLKEWMIHYADLKRKEGRSGSRAKQVENVMDHLISYRGDGIVMKQVDKNFCIGFLYYLSTAKAKYHPKKDKSKGKEKILEKTSARCYFDIFNGALNQAVRDGIINVNPCNKISKSEKKPIDGEGSEIHYLSLEEVKALSNAKCPNENVKKAFLFACNCGLRISDVIHLTWMDLRLIDGTHYIIKQIIKSAKHNYIPLNQSALQWLPERGDAKSNAFIFEMPSYSSICYNLEKLGKSANLPFKLHFHVSRHTFATSLLTVGADLYTTSKLLGHRSLKTTQIYAEIVDKKRQDAVNLLDAIGIMDDKQDNDEEKKERE